MGVYIGIDVGTSATKALACNEKGKILARATAEYPLSHPKPGWSEQNPEHWWQATVKTTRQLLRQGRIKPADVKGIGLSGQMHGSVFLDRSDKVIRPAILWNDQRTGPQCDEIERCAGGRAALIQMVANPALTGFTAPKVLWLREHEPRYYERTRKILLPKDYVRFRMTGEYATEVSDASGTLLLDVAHRQWSKSLLGKLQVDPALLPACYESEEVSGKITQTAAKELSVPAGTPVVGGGGDQAAGAVGNGIVRGGIISATTGTSGVVFAHSDEVQTDPEGRVHTFCHAVHGKWHVMGVVLSAGGSFQWFRNQLGQAEVEQARFAATRRTAGRSRLAATRRVAGSRSRPVDPYDLLTAEAAKAPPGSEGLFWLPYLTGERTPHADPYARAAWIGLTPRHGRPHLIRSLLEGATFAMRDCLEIIRGMGIPVRQIRLSGGGARSPFWRQLQADIYGQKVVTINAEEGPAYGVALLAAVGTGAYKNVAEACDTAIKVVHQINVNRRNNALYDQAYPIYQKLYRSLRDDFRQISRLVGS